MIEKSKNTLIPGELKPLYTKVTAGEVISSAAEMLQTRNTEEQRTLLINPFFSNIVNQALEGSDQYREKKFERLLQGVAPENLDLALRIFGQLEQGL